MCWTKEKKVKTFFGILLRLYIYLGKYGYNPQDTDLCDFKPFVHFIPAWWYTPTISLDLFLYVSWTIPMGLLNGNICHFHTNVDIYIWIRRCLQGNQEVDGEWNKMCQNEDSWKRKISIIYTMHKYSRFAHHTTMRV